MRIAAGLALAGLLWAGSLAVPGAAPAPETLTVLVMDPLSKPLCCACVAGTGQRDYESLGRYLAKALNLPVRVVFSTSLIKALDAQLDQPPDLLIGKDSVIRAEARQCQVPVTAAARLTDLQGRDTLTGLFVVKTGDPARTLADLAGRPLWLGPVDAEEKHGAALAALHDAGIEGAAAAKLCPDCTATANDLLESRSQPAPVGVISSYALPLLEGCGNIPARSLRVVGRTAPVPFITVFFSHRLPEAVAARGRTALLAAGRQPALCRALESSRGFVPVVDEAAALAEWPGWLGARRDGHAASLPERLPDPLPVVWERPMNLAGLAGVTVSGGYVLVADRDPLDTADLWRCVRAENGQTVWTLRYPARGERLDYGNSPRAAPLVAEGRAYLLGAYGDLHCVELSSGKVLWKRHLARDLKGRLPKWGFAGAPLLSDGLLIVNPGGVKSALAALDPVTGKTRWTTPGEPPGYASFIAVEAQGRRQIIGYDETSLGGWDPLTGRRLWRLTPPKTGDFNVPTPQTLAGGLLVATENNGLRRHFFNERGCPAPEADAIHADLIPTTATPLVLGRRVFGSGGGLRCVEWQPRENGWKTIWKTDDEAFHDHAAFIAGSGRLLVLGYHGDLLLLEAAAPAFQPLSRLQLFADEELYAHPAVTGGRLFVRARQVLRCYSLHP